MKQKKLAGKGNAGYLSVPRMSANDNGEKKSNLKAMSRKQSTRIIKWAQSQ